MLGDGLHSPIAAQSPAHFPSAEGSERAPIEEGAQTAPAKPASRTADAVVLPRITVVDALGNPVAGVPVTAWRDHSESLPHDPLVMSMYKQMSQISPVNPPAEGSVKLVSDAEGRVNWLVEEPGHWIVLANQGSLSGMIKVLAHRKGTAGYRGLQGSPERYAQEVELSPSRSVTVTVIDEDQKPIPSAIVICFDPDADGQHVAYISLVGTEDLHHAFTNTVGQATWRAWESNPLSVFRARRLRFYVLRVGGKCIEKDFAWGDGHSALTLVATGLVQTKVLPFAESGTPLASQFTLRWQQGPPPRPTWWDGWNHCGGGPIQLAEVAESKMACWQSLIPPEGRVLSCFARGAAIGYHIAQPGRPGRTGTWTAPETKHGQVPIQVSEPLARIRVRIQDRLGEDITSDGFRFSTGETGVRTEALRNGNHVEFATKPGLDGKLKVIPFGTGVFGDPGWGSVPIENPVATLNWRKLNPGEVHDLAPIQVDRAPALIEGRVIDWNGKAVAGASLALHWNGAHFATSTTNEKGYFSLHHRVSPAAKLTIKAHCPRGTSDLIAFSHGDNLSIKLEPHGSLAGRIIMPLDVRGALRASLHSPHLPRPRMLPLKAGGRFKLQGLTFGTYSMSVTIHDQELARIEDINVNSVDISRPKSLQNISVAENYESVLVRVMDSHGSPVRGAGVTYIFGLQAGLAEMRHSATTNKRGETRLLVPRGPDLKLKVIPPYGRTIGNSALSEIIAPALSFPLTVTLPTKQP